MSLEQWTCLQLTVKIDKVTRAVNLPTGEGLKVVFLYTIGSQIEQFGHLRIFASFILQWQNFTASHWKLWIGYNCREKALQVDCCSVQYINCIMRWVSSMNILLVQRCLECKLLPQCKLAKDSAMRIKLITNTTMDTGPEAIQSIWKFKANSNWKRYIANTIAPTWVTTTIYQHMTCKIN
jgi:hypothetical protein